mmetsp:Transcript_35302/g.72240  ORF Transcript_35302/g.72240 Transcript_35302/m.72240 type:complete len:88 (+) Transcript_35302:556-819(+)
MLAAEGLFQQHLMILSGMELLNGWVSPPGRVCRKFVRTVITLTRRFFSLKETCLGLEPERGKERHTFASKFMLIVPENMFVKMIDYK